MINNEFHLIGIATSNYQNIGNKRFKSCLLRVEVEKFGSKSGQSFELEVQIYGTNDAIDTDADILGEQIAINGYVDFYTTKEGATIVKLVAQRIYVLGHQKRKINPTPKSVEPVDTPTEEEEEETFDEIVDKLNESSGDTKFSDDLPF